MTKVLILHSKQYAKLLDNALAAVCILLKENKIEMEVISVLRVESLPCAASMSLELYEYDGLIILGCMILNENRIKYTVAYQEITRCFSDLAVHYALPLGFGVSAFDGIEEAEEKMAQFSVAAANDCIDLLKLKNQLGFPVHEQFSRYSN